MKPYVATIQVLLCAESQGDACDAISGLFEMSDESIRDWASLRVVGGADVNYDYENAGRETRSKAEYFIR